MPDQPSGSSNPPPTTTVPPGSAAGSPEHVVSPIAADHQARLAVFFVSLPENLPVVHHTTIGFDLGAEVPALSGLPMRPTSTLPNAPRARASYHCAFGR
jgi:hypothetical protein